MDPENQVVKLCTQGMQAEGEGRPEVARAFFEQAWAARKDNYDACVAAHFLARHQDDPQAEFKWNKEALDRANAVTDERARDFFSSLYLNLGHSYEVLGNRTEARRHYEMALDKLGDVPDGPYKDIVRNGISGGYQRTESVEE